MRKCSSSSADTSSCVSYNLTKRGLCSTQLQRRFMEPRILLQANCITQHSKHFLLSPPLLSATVYSRNVERVVADSLLSCIIQSAQHAAAYAAAAVEQSLLAAAAAAAAAQNTGIAAALYADRMGGGGAAAAGQQLIISISGAQSKREEDEAYQGIKRTLSEGRDCVLMYNLYVSSTSTVMCTPSLFVIVTLQCF